MALMWWEKGLWQICMYHWTEHGKVDFPKFPSGVCSEEKIVNTITTLCHLTVQKLHNVNIYCLHGWTIDLLLLYIYLYISTLLHQ